MSETSQFGLLGKKRLLPLFCTQSLVAFNDNLFKAALSVIFVFGYLIADENENLYVNLAAALFIVPFFLFSATAGTIADQYEKSRLIRIVKMVEVAVACLIALALYSRQVWLLLVVLFLLGAQSSFFSPLKFSILPQHLKETELIGGNAILGMGTFVAILIGTIVGGIIGGIEDHSTIALGLSALVILVAVAGFCSSLFIPQAPSVYKGKPGWNPIKETIGLIRIASEKDAVIKSILGVSWFWTLGSVYIAQFAKLTEEHLLGSSVVVPVLLGIVTITIALGSLTCEWLSGRRIEIGLVPVGAFGVSIFGIDLYFAIEAITATEVRTLSEFLSVPSTFRVLIDMAFVGFFLGLYVVPLQTVIQARTPIDRRARVIAANNIINSICIVLGAAISIVVADGGQFQHSKFVVVDGPDQHLRMHLHLRAGAGIHFAIRVLDSFPSSVPDSTHRDGAHSGAGCCPNHLQSRQLHRRISAAGVHSTPHSFHHGKRHLRRSGTEVLVQGG